MLYYIILYYICLRVICVHIHMWHNNMVTGTPRDLSVNNFLCSSMHYTDQESPKQDDTHETIFIFFFWLLSLVIATVVVLFLTLSSVTSTLLHSTHLLSGFPTFLLPCTSIFNILCPVYSLCVHSALSLYICL